MNEVKVGFSELVMIVEVPYHPDFVRRAKELGGDYSRGSWAFSAMQDTQVFALLLDVFGTDGTKPVDICDARLDLDGHLDIVRAPACDVLYFAGREIVRRGADKRTLHLDDGTVIVRGYFRPESRHPSGQPDLSPAAGTVLEVRDVPLALVRREMARFGGVTIVADSIRLAGTQFSTSTTPPQTGADLSMVPTVELVAALAERWCSQHPNLAALLLSARDEAQRAAVLVSALKTAEEELPGDNEARHAAAHRRAWVAIERRAVEVERTKGPHGAEDIGF